MVIQQGAFENTSESYLKSLLAVTITAIANIMILTKSDNPFTEARPALKSSVSMSLIEKASYRKTSPAVSYTLA